MWSRSWIKAQALRVALALSTAVVLVGLIPLGIWAWGDLTRWLVSMVVVTVAVSAVVLVDAEVVDVDPPMGLTASLSRVAGMHLAVCIAAGSVQTAAFAVVIHRGVSAAIVSVAMVFGAVAGFWRSLAMWVREQQVIEFPAIQNLGSKGRIIQTLVPSFLAAIRDALLCLPFCAVLDVAVADEDVARVVRHVHVMLPSISLMFASWNFGLAVLKIVHSRFVDLERVSLDDTGDPNSSMMYFLTQENDGVMQSLALEDLYHVARYSKARRIAIFSDPSGKRLRGVLSSCHSLIDSCTESIYSWNMARRDADAKLSQKADISGRRERMSRPMRYQGEIFPVERDSIWSSSGLDWTSRRSDRQSLNAPKRPLSSRPFQKASRVRRAAECLTLLHLASRKEDPYGVAQRSLRETMASLLACYDACSQHAHLSGTLPAQEARTPQFGSAGTLADVLSGLLQQLAHAYQQYLASLSRDPSLRWNPRLAPLLERFLQYRALR